MNQKYVPNNSNTWQKRKMKSSWSQVTVQTSCQRRQPLNGRISKPARDGITVLETTSTSKMCKLLVRQYLWRNRQQNPLRATKKNYWPKGYLPEYNEACVFGGEKAQLLLYFQTRNKRPWFESNWWPRDHLSLLSWWQCSSVFNKARCILQGYKSQCPKKICLNSNNQVQSPGWLQHLSWLGFTVLHSRSQVGSQRERPWL